MMVAEHISGQYRKEFEMGNVSNAECNLRNVEMMPELRGNECYCLERSEDVSKISLTSPKTFARASSNHKLLRIQYSPSNAHPTGDS